MHGTMSRVERLGNDVHEVFRFLHGTVGDGKPIPLPVPKLRNGRRQTRIERGIVGGSAYSEDVKLRKFEKQRGRKVNPIDSALDAGCAVLFDDDE